MSTVFFHGCSECGQQVDESCAQHPAAIIDSIQVGTWREDDAEFRAAYVTNGQREMLLTTPEQAHLDDDMLLAAGVRELLRNA
jgi:hypothetical protein